MLTAMLDRDWISGLQQICCLFSEVNLTAVDRFVWRDMGRVWIGGFGREKARFTHEANGRTRLIPTSTYSGGSAKGCRNLKYVCSHFLRHMQVLRQGDDGEMVWTYMRSSTPVNLIGTVLGELTNPHISGTHIEHFKKESFS
jgi:hypothetical protein